MKYCSFGNLLFVAGLFTVFIALILGPLIGIIFIKVPRYFPYDTSPEKVGFNSDDYTKLTLYSKLDHDSVNKTLPISAWYFPSIFTKNNSKMIENSKTANKTNENATIVVVHGHGSSMAREIGQDISVLEKAVIPLWNAGFNVLALDLRNHGQSGYSGYVTLGYYESLDVITGIEYLINEKKSTRIGLWGESMGGATVLLTGSSLYDNSIRNYINAIVADSAFSSVEGAMYGWCKTKLPFIPISVIDYLFFWFDLFLPIPVDKLRIFEIMNTIDAPLMIVHGTGDTLVPYENAEILIASLQHHNQSIFHFYSHNFGHVAPWNEQDKYFPQLISFFELHV